MIRFFIQYMFLLFVFNMIKSNVKKYDGKYIFMHEEIVSVLKTELNPWWIDGNPPPEHRDPHRLYYPILEQRVLQGRKDQVVALIGLRRTGKTHMLMQVIGSAIATGQYNPKQIVFVSGDEPRLRRMGILDIVRLIKRELVNPEQDWLLIIDEVQFFNEWEHDLKVIADRQPFVRCAVSGSSARILKKKRSETGLGRIDEMRLPPLLFCEYLKQFRHAWPSNLPMEGFHAMLDVQLPSEELETLNQEFINYINFGAFPSLAYEYKNGGCESWEQLRASAQRNVVAFYVEHELPLLFGVNSSDLLRRLGERLVNNNATQYSEKQTRQELETNDFTLRKYLDFLEGAYFIKCFRKIDQHLKFLKHRHTHCKFILENCSMPSLAKERVKEDSHGIGNRVEAATLAQFDKKRPFEEYGYLEYRRLARPLEIDLCYLNEERWPKLLAEIKWKDDNKVFEQVSGGMQLLARNWSKKKKAKPELYCTSKASYGDGAQLGAGMRVIPAAQFSAALGMDRIDGA